jgi:hypothetical protein
MSSEGPCIKKTIAESLCIVWTFPIRILSVLWTDLLMRLAFEEFNHNGSAIIDKALHSN